MRLPFPSRGVYAITSAELSDEQTVVAVEKAIRGGARAVQFRAKAGRPRQAPAERLLALCQRENIPLIVNDDIVLARAIGADGVHLGKEDETIEKAKTLLGERAIIGISCYDSLERALKAQAQGAAYIAFGRFFPSKTKPHAASASLETVRRARKILQIPIVAIGGITPSNGHLLLKAGADLLAVIEGIFGQEDSQKAAESYSRLFKDFSPEIP